MHGIFNFFDFFKVFRISDSETSVEKTDLIKTELFIQNILITKFNKLITSNVYSQRRFARKSFKYKPFLIIKAYYTVKTEGF